MSTLIIVEHNNKALGSNTAIVLTAALELDADTVLLVAGHQCSAVAEEAAALAGVGKVLLVDNPCYEHLLAEDASKLIQNLHNIHAFSYILAPSSSFGKDLLPRLAACLEVIQVSNVSKILSADTFEHPIYAGNAIETVRLLDTPKVLTIRLTAFARAQSSANRAPIELVEAIFAEKKPHFVSHELSTSTRPDLNTAKIIVSGGRALQSAEKFKLVEELADALGAAVGASRAAVDAGFVPNEYQIGQTGRIVAPDVYIAIGISGAVQHMAGMKDSKVIVAINKDADAPIFQSANYGLVGDLFELLPQLIEEINLRKIK